MRQLLVMGMLALIFGGSMTILFAHAVNRQQTIMQEGYAETGR